MASSATLRLEPGVEFRHSEIKVEGTLDAEGTAADPIVFKEGAGLKFRPGSGASVVSHTEFVAVGNGAVEVIRSSPTIADSVFRNCAEKNILAPEGGAPEIARDRFLHPGYSAVYYRANSGQSGAIDIHDNFVEGGALYGSIDIEISSPNVVGETLGGNTLTDATATGSAPLIYVGPDVPPDITENTLESNVIQQIAAFGTMKQDATWKAAGVPIFTGFDLVSGTTLHIQHGTLVELGSITVNGTLDVEGTALEPVHFRGLGGAGHGAGLVFEPESGGSALEYFEVAQIGTEGRGAVEVHGSSPTFTQGSFREDGLAMLVSSGGPSIEWSRFRKDGHGIRYEGVPALYALHNDWGCKSGPTPYGCGIDVYGNVLWKPTAVLGELPQYCSGTASAPANRACLLEKYEPILSYDSLETYSADNAAEITDNWGDEENGFEGENKAADPYSNSLRDGDSEMEAPNFGYLAESQPGNAFFPFRLTIAALGSTYPNAQAADENDWLDEGESDHEKDAHEMEAAGYGNQAYGHVEETAGGTLWLEYWYWYYYNPEAIVGFGKHEGDWESILIKLNSEDEPEEVIFSEHTGGSKCAIGAVASDEEDHPISYVALESHANYPRPGEYSGPVSNDYANGEGPSVFPSLVDLDALNPDWIKWPGHWGDTRPEVTPIESTSPTGPAFHEAWEDPVSYYDNADGCRHTVAEEEQEEKEKEIEEEVGGAGFNNVESSGSAVQSEILEVNLEGAYPKVTYRVPTGRVDTSWPHLKMAVNELGDDGVMPTAVTLGRIGKRGTATVPIELGGEKPVQISASLFYRSGRRVELSPVKINPVHSVSPHARPPSLHVPRRWRRGSG